MLRLTLAGLVRHRARMAATAISVVLGIAFVAGTYVLTDTLHAAFNTLFSQSAQGIAVVVTGRSALPGDQSSLATPPIPDSVVAKVGRVPGVAAADGQVVGFAQLIGPSGRPAGNPYAPTLALSVGTVPSMRVLTLQVGRLPESGSEVVVDRATAASEHLRVGQRVEVSGSVPLRPFTVVGLVDYGTAQNLGGATILGFDLRTAQAEAGTPGKVQSVDVAAEPGVTPPVLAARVAAALGSSYRVQTAAQSRQESSAQLAQSFSILSTALLVFAGVALFVAAFIIFNTFAVVVAQRSRELALLRCLGARRAQLLTMVLGEAGAVGLGASAVGLGVGVAIAAGLESLLGRIGVELPAAPLQVEARTVAVSLVVGTLVTLAAAALPAVRAGRSAPLAALRDDHGTETATSRPLRWAAGGVLLAAGVASTGLGLAGAGGLGLQLVGAGVAATFLGLAALAPFAVRPLAGGLGRPLAAVTGIPGRLARGNAVRHPKRTASTSAALMIGVTLITVVAVFSQTIKASLTTALATGLTADVVVTPRSVASAGFAPTVTAALAARPELAGVTGVASGRAELAGVAGGVGVRVTGVAVPAYRSDIRLATVAGSLDRLSSGPGAARAVAVSDTFATAHRLAAGSVLRLTFPTSGTRQLDVVAVFHDPTTASGEVLMGEDVFRSSYPVRVVDQAVLARFAPGVSQPAGLAAVRHVLAAYPQLQVQTAAQYVAQQEGNVDQLLGLITALLGLAVVIALFGIVNTLALSVLERTREIGLLRILGMGRHQVRAMIRWESVIITVLGALAGVVVGIGYGWVLSRALRSKGISTFAVPVPLLAAVVGAAALAGLVAAILPARRASRIEVLAAIEAD